MLAAIKSYTQTYQILSTSSPSSDVRESSCFKSIDGIRVSYEITVHTTKIRSLSIILKNIYKLDVVFKVLQVNNKK